MPQLIDLGKLRFFFAGEYNPATTYEINDVVKYGGNVYIYISVISAYGNEPTDNAYWSLMLEGLNFQGPYSTATAYKIGDGVAHGGVVYIAIADNQNVTPPNPTYWSKFVDGIQYEGTYNGATTYQKNDIVTYGGRVYIAKVDGASHLPTNGTYWDKLVDGISASGVYNDATAYVPGDTVAYGANTYICILETTGNVPTNGTYWSQFTGGITYRNEWAATTQYYPNDVVNRGGKTYICLLAHVSSTFTSDLTGIKWEVFNGGVRVTGNFAAFTDYLAGDLAFDGVDTYIANQEFTSGADIAADLDKWDVFAKGADYLPGQVGNQGKFLNTDGTAAYWGYDANKLYVGDVNVVDATAEDVETAKGLTDAAVVINSSSASFTQIAFTNEGTGPESSADIIVYANNGDNSVGFMDMGITNSNFDSTNYGITGPGDGYIFVNGVPAATSTAITAVLSGNIATITTNAAHNLIAGKNVFIFGVNPTYDGNYEVLDTPSPTTFRYNKVHANVSSASVSGGVFQSRGAGNLVLATGDQGTDNSIVFAAGGYASGNTQMTIIPDERVHIEIPTPSVDSSTGALTVVGGVGIQGDLNMDGNLSVGSGGIEARDQLYVGADAKTTAQNVGTNVKTVSFKERLSGNVAKLTTTTPHGYGLYQEVTVSIGDGSFDGSKVITGIPTSTTFTYDNLGPVVSITATSGTISAVTGFTNPMAVFVGNYNNYSQIAVQNIGTDPSSSTDFIAYANNGNDFAGYIDIGITSEFYNDPEFTITKANDGYIFVDAPQGTTGGGNLVLATGGKGTENKIVFAAGGLDSDTSQMVITPNQNVKINIATPSTSPTTGAFQVVGGVGILGDVNIAGTITFGGSGTTVSTANLSVTDPLIFVGLDNPQNGYELGIIGEYALATTLDPVATVTAAEIVDNVATLTITYGVGAENFRVNDSVTVTSVGASFNGTYVITAKTGSTISYAKTAADQSLTGLSGAANATDVYRPKWTGFVKDNTDGVWKLVSNIATKPSAGSVNFTGVTYDGIQVGSATAATVTATTSVSTPLVTITNALPTLASHATRKDYVDSVTFMHPFMMAAL